MTGSVTLVGGGPGREDLLTLAGARALADADVVLFDRLAPHERLHELAPGAELVDVGKRPGHHAIPQLEIEALIVAHARAGAHVVRLKGGDPRRPRAAPPVPVVRERSERARPVDRARSRARAVPPGHRRGA